MLKIITRFLLVVFLSACSTGVKMVLSPAKYGGSQFSPVNEELSPGIIKYRSVEGMASATQKRRDEAYRKMFEACSGKYKIIDESISTESNVSGSGDNVSTSRSDYIVIKFECVK